MACKAPKKITSIEDNLFWYSKLSAKIDALKLHSKIDYRLSENLDDYASQTSSFADDSIDFCLIDGKVRDRCAISMVAKMKSGSILLIDNAETCLANDLTFSPYARRSSD